MTFAKKDIAENIVAWKLLPKHYLAKSLCRIITQSEELKYF
jgi:hypothetical protein